MSVSHRKFGDLLEEGIKRVHIARKKPIGYILDEFGYELRPEDSTKGRHALGHWYYKKRIPASMDDVAKLAELIVINSEVERDWLSSFLDSAGYPDAEKFCDKFFLAESKMPQPSVYSAVEQHTIESSPVDDVKLDTTPIRSGRSWKVYVLGVILVFGVTSLFFLIPRMSKTPPGNVTSTYASIPLVISPTMTVVRSTETNIPEDKPTSLPVTLTPDFVLFDGKCPEVSSTSVFEYASPASFKDFLDGGGSFVALQSGFNALVQKKVDLLDGRIISTDLTGDDVPEVLLSATLQNGSIWQVLGCNAGEYAPLVDIVDPAILYLRFAVDLNGNRLPEIVGYRQTEVETTWMYEFFIQGWNGHRIIDLTDGTRFDEVGGRLPVDISDWQRLIANATVTTQDTNGDGLYEVVMTGGLVTPVPTCETRFERQFTEIWAWNGRSFQFADRVYIPPIYRFQRSADGDLAYALRQFDRALGAYQDVLFDPDLFRRDQYLSHLEYCKGIGPAVDSALVANEREQLNAYARWRILLINAMDGSADAMQVVYQTLQEKFPDGMPGHSYAVIASAFWDEFQASQDIKAACDKANRVAAEQMLYPSHAADNICFIP